MTVFYLPDLGEGLPDAEIRSWYIQVGDTIAMDMPMVAMETAKAVVDIPAPFSGKIIRLYGDLGDVIKTGEALIDIEENDTPTSLSDTATVVGNLQNDDTLIEESAIGISPTCTTDNQKIKATPAIRALAKRMGVELRHCIGTGQAGQIVPADLEKAANVLKVPEETTEMLLTQEPIKNYESLRGVRRAMAVAMSRSHQVVVPVTLIDDADIHAWPEKTDVTLRLIRAIMVACQREPRLNSWFDDTKLALMQHQHINLGIAMDAPDGLFVPVLKNVSQCNAATLRKTIDLFKREVKNRSIPPEALSGATFILSNVGIFAGRYASPVIIPPMVAILAAGRIMDAVVAHQGKPTVHKLLPLSLTVDHRVITGGEAARFLSALIRDLQTS